MNQKALERLTKCGWTKDRHVDISKIEKQYRDFNIEMPDIVRSFLESFQDIKVIYPLRDPYVHKEEHCFDGNIDYEDKTELETLFEDYGLIGMVYPLGCAYRYNMELYYHENGKFYQYMGGGPLQEIGKTVDEMLDVVIGDDFSTWKDIEPID